MHLRIILIAFGSLFALPTTGLAQGSLTPPPGAPAPSMKSLTDLDTKLSTLVAKADPRTPLSQATLDDSGAGYIVINTSGSYYFTSNIVIPNSSILGIYINAPDVTLDLNGYTLSVAGTNAATSFGAIYIAAPGGDLAIANTTVRNGTILGTGTRTAGANPWLATFSGAASSRGIFCQRVGASWGSNHFRFEGLTVRGFNNGIDLNISGLEHTGGRAILSRCHVLDCAGVGITGQFLDLADVVIAGCNSHGIRTDGSALERVVIERCGGDGVNGGSNTLRSVAARFLGGTGFNLSGNSRANDIVASGTARGIYGNLVTLQGVSAQNNRGHGLELYSSAVSGFMLSGNSGSGLSGNNNSLSDGTTQGNTSHGVVSPQSSVRNVTSFGNTGAGIYCDDSSITGCLARINGDDGIRGIASVIADCRAYSNDTTAGGYAALGIVWGGGKITNSLADTASPAIP